MVMSRLFEPLPLRGLTIPNRVFVSPMCEYSCTDGLANDWHLVHLGSRAVGGCGLVLTEAASVSPEGRITPWDAGIWNEAQVVAWKPIVNFIKTQGVVPGIQLAHAGRKASCSQPWAGGKPLEPLAGGWETLGPSAVPFGRYPPPREMTAAQIEACIADFRRAAERSLEAGFEVAEVHAAHGYLLHEFLSPLSNRRTDEFGGSLPNRMRFPLAVCRAVREAWPQDRPVFVRISASDWKEGGWEIGQSVAFCRELKAIGIDLVDVSSGGNAHDQEIVLGPGYQVPFATAIRNEAAIPTAAVGLITEAVQAEHVVSTGQADAVCLARALLRDPYWARHAAKALGVELAWPNQYLRADVSPLGR
jgi:2,4-dienoyl-CoA reductase-like NADH-dependent reductase (Old Yellow Enzyme family)